MGKEEPVPTQPIEHKAYGFINTQARRTRSDAEFSLDLDQSINRQEEAAAPSASARNFIETLLSEVPAGEDGRISFYDVVAYKGALESQWDSEINDGLARLGVDMSRPFRLMIDPSSGKVTAGSDHPDKARIDAYFAANHDKETDFRKIVQFGKLADHAQNSLSDSEMEERLVPQAMAWWYRNNMDTSSLFTGGGVIFGSGGSSYKGLDIRV